MTDAARGAMTEREAAVYLQVSPRHLWTLRQRGEIPHARVGRLVRYRQADLDGFLDRLVAPTAARRAA